MWWGFGLLAFGASLFTWIAVSLLAIQPMPVLPLLFQLILTVALFPGIAWILMQAQRLTLKRT